MTGLENDELSRGGRPSFNGSPTGQPSDTLQLGLFRAPATAESTLLERLRTIDIENLTPLDALALLAELKQSIDPSGS